MDWGEQRKRRTEQRWESLNRIKYYDWYGLEDEALERVCALLDSMDALLDSMEGKEAITLIAKEGERQIAEEGWTPEHDAEHADGALAMAAACYAAPQPIFIRLEAESFWLSGNTGDRGDRQLRPEGYYDAWPWDEEWDKREKHDRLKRLIIAGALIAAEIDRLLRQKESPPAAV